MYYITYYKEYPIYEPAEGGYYYSGTENLQIWRFQTLKKAMKAFNKLAKEFKEMYDNVNICPLSYIGRWGEGSAAYNYSKYIGGGAGIVITKGKPAKEQGKQIYC